MVLGAWTLPVVSAHASSPLDLAPDVSVVSASAPSAASLWESTGELTVRTGRSFSLAPASPSTYAIQFTCPPSKSLLPEETACPVRIVDRDDILGNPGLAIDPNDLSRMSVSSLHGGPRDGPTPLAREGGTLTTLTYDSRLFGTRWRDQPTYRGEYYTLDIDGYVDKTSTLHIAALYAHGHGEPNATWRYEILTWKFDEGGVTRIDYDPSHGTFHNRTNHSIIEQVWLLGLPEYNRVALLWKERAPEGTTASINGKDVKVWLSGAITKMDSFSPWKPLTERLFIEGCEDFTNPVAFQSRIYLGCRSESLSFHRIDVKKNETQRLGTVKLEGPTPILAASRDGQFALVNVDTPSETKATAHVTTSRNGKHWGRSFEFGDLLHNNVTQKIAMNRFTAAHYSAATNTIHLVYEEEATQAERDAGQPQWRKSLAVIDPVGAVLVNLDLDLSDKGEVFGTSRGPDSTDVYGDFRDSIREIDGHTFIAIADYGVVMFAELLELDEREIEIVYQQPPPPPDPVPTVQATGLLTSQGAAAGLVSVIALRRLAAQRFAVGAGKGK